MALILFLNLFSKAYNGRCTQRDPLLQMILEGLHTQQGYKFRGHLYHLRLDLHRPRPAALS